MRRVAPRIAQTGAGSTQKIAKNGFCDDDQERRDDSEEHRDAAEARRRRLVDVALADAGIQLVLQAEPPDTPREREGDDGGE